MKKILIVSAAALALAATAAQADNRYRHRAQHHHHQHNGGGWGAPLLGGLIIGGIVGGMMAQPYLENRRRCPYGTEPRRVQVRDEWGRYVGDQIVCVEY